MKWWLVMWSINCLGAGVTPLGRDALGPYASKEECMEVLAATRWGNDQLVVTCSPGDVAPAPSPATPTYPDVRAELARWKQCAFDGDLNCDGAFGIADFSIWTAAQARRAPPPPEPAPTP